MYTAAKAFLGGTLEGILYELESLSEEEALKRVDSSQQHNIYAHPHLHEFLRTLLYSPNRHQVYYSGKAAGAKEESKHELDSHEGFVAYFNPPVKQ